MTSEQQNKRPPAPFMLKSRNSPQPYYDGVSSEAQHQFLLQQQAAARQAVSADDHDSWRYNEESTKERVLRKFWEWPAAFIGVGAGVSMFAYLVRRFKTQKHRRGFATDMYVLQSRIVIQATIVGCVLMGYGYNVYKARQDEAKKNAAFSAMQSMEEVMGSAKDGGT